MGSLQTFDETRHDMTRHDKTWHMDATALMTFDRQLLMKPWSPLRRMGSVFQRTPKDRTGQFRHPLPQNQDLEMECSSIFPNAPRTSVCLSISESSGSFPTRFLPARLGRRILFSRLPFDKSHAKHTRSMFGVRCWKCGIGSMHYIHCGLPIIYIHTHKIIRLTSKSKLKYGCLLRHLDWEIHPHLPANEAISQSI